MTQHIKWFMDILNYIFTHFREFEVITMALVVAFSVGLYVGAKMSLCADCKHFEQTTKESGICDVKSDNWFDTYVLANDDAPCEKFEPYEDSWESVSK